MLLLGFSLLLQKICLLLGKTIERSGAETPLRFDEAGASTWAARSRSQKKSVFMMLDKFWFNFDNLDDNDDYDEDYDTDDKDKTWRY